METPEPIRLFLQQGVTSLDFSDAYFHAYFHIPINQVSRKYLQFHLEDQTLQFRALPFGLYTTPMEVHHCGQGGKAHGSGKGNLVTTVPRRLANLESDQGILLLPDIGPVDPFTTTSFWFQNQTTDGVPFWISVL